MMHDGMQRLTADLLERVAGHLLSGGIHYRHTAVSIDGVYTFGCRIQERIDRSLEGIAYVDEAQLRAATVRQHHDFFRRWRRGPHLLPQSDCGLQCGRVECLDPGSNRVPAFYLGWVVRREVSQTGQLTV